MVWLLRLGPLGLAVGLEEGREIAEMLHTSEQEYLAAYGRIYGHKEALINFEARFQAWALRVREMVDAKE